MRSRFDNHKKENWSGLVWNGCLEMYWCGRDKNGKPRVSRSEMLQLDVHKYTKTCCLLESYINRVVVLFASERLGVYSLP
jgi:hypothetical protein